MIKSGYKLNMMTSNLENLSQKVKSDFPFFHHNPDTVYLDSAATSLKPEQVINAITKYYREYSANIHRGVYKASMEATQVYENTREVIKKFIGAGKNFEVVYIRNTTEGMNLLSHTLMDFRGNLGSSYTNWENGFERGDVILITESEHHSNIVPWQMVCEKTGAELVFIPVNHNGQLNEEAFSDIKRQLSGKTVKIVSLSQVSNVTGIVHDIEPFKKYARDKGAVFIIDGAQAICHHTINLESLDADAFIFSAHKMLGPTGTGVLVARKEILDKIPPFLGGGDMILDVTKEHTIYNTVPHKFEAGTPDIAGVFGLNAAIEYLQSVGMENILAWEKTLLKYAFEKLEPLGLEIYGPESSELDHIEKVGVFSFNIPGVHPHDVGSIMDENNVCIRAGHHCCQLLMQAWKTPATNRASFYLYNDFSDIDKLADAIGHVRQIFKK
jgi:cysteine desulfurase/selenocysteine lyase